MRLNLGCGDDVRDGYVNVDFRKTRSSVFPVDLSVFPWPFADDSAEEILMLDFLEHFPYAQTKQILLECHRVLRDVRPIQGTLVPAGTGVVIQVPNAEILGTVISGHGRFQCNRCGGWMKGFKEEDWDQTCPMCNQPDDAVIDAAMRRMFGGQDFPGNFHHTCFTPNSLTRIARSCGLYWSCDREHAHQAANWNFKSVFFKGDVW